MHSADDGRSVLEPVLARHRDANIPRTFRGDRAIRPKAYMRRGFSTAEVSETRRAFERG